METKPQKTRLPIVQFKGASKIKPTSKGKTQNTKQIRKRKIRSRSKKGKLPYS